LGVWVFMFFGIFTNFTKSENIILQNRPVVVYPHSSRG
jgi:hypothetical protein